jgi:hypothetical protein
MRSRPPTSYAWALHSDLSDVPDDLLSEAALEGLEYAEQLARDAPLRSRQALRNQPALAPLTEAHLAAEEGVPVALIRARIKRARKELFGSLTDSGIYKREQAQRAAATQRKNRPACAHLECPNPLSAQARSNRRYCDLHASPREKVRRHRAARESP